jgi:pimeloyl-ACP methyl ester carboxylesterase
MANFVLVPGYWLGGWAWKNVTDVLRKKGHTVYPVTLTGLGERVHLGSAQTNLDTHVADVVNLIKFEELDDVYLVGHSYAGIVITQVADKIPELIAKLIYLDSAPLPDGAAHVDFYPPEQLAGFEKAIAEHGDGWKLPLPSWQEMDEGDALKDLTEQDKKRIEKLATAQPFNASRQKISLKNPARRELLKVVILTTYTTAQIKALIALGTPLFQELADPNLTFVELPTGHYPMFSRPTELTEILLDSLAQPLVPRIATASRREK